jgi:DNA-binding HxlR family transcriptional regulator
VCVPQHPEIEALNVQEIRKLLVFISSILLAQMLNGLAIIGTHSRTVNPQSKYAVRRLNERTMVPICLSSRHHCQPHL